MSYPDQKKSVGRTLVRDGLYHDMVIQHILPFGFRDTEKAVWTCLQEIGLGSVEDVKDYSKHVDYHPQHEEMSDNTFITNFFVSTPDQKEIRGVQARQVVRKYIEETLTVFICQTPCTPRLEGIDSAAGHQISNMLRVTVEHQTLQGEDAAASVLRLHFTTPSREIYSMNSSFRAPGLHLSITHLEIISCRLPNAVENFLVDNSARASC
ncbi:hypothetical protein L914_12441 [Phytophthora nicotianae]|uniref:Uncharacterized protein n=1 Tax=Phytophthora nicotianae TaxID=4792 RepID=W2N1T4_PHYNI|nr:hypothetical protein L914_12441 [Phytophthora nicotianae]